jgi:hypothetical protein
MREVNKIYLIDRSSVLYPKNAVERRLDQGHADSLSVQRTLCVLTQHGKHLGGHVGHRFNDKVRCSKITINVISNLFSGPLITVDEFIKRS